MTLAAELLGEQAAERAAHAATVRGLFGRIAGVYDILNRVFSFGFDALWRNRLAEAVRPFPPRGTGRILDLAAGTLEVSVALAKRYPHRLILAMDFCRPMLVKGLPKLARLRPPVARGKAGRRSAPALPEALAGPIEPTGPAALAAGPAFSGQTLRCRVFPLVGDGRRLPLPDASVDAITLAFGLRNILPREEVYAEARRVLVPGGRLCVLEFGSAGDRILFGLYNFYLAQVMPRIGRLISGDKGAYRYLAATVAAFPTAEALADEMRAAGFYRVSHSRHTGGIVCLHVAEKGLD